MSSALASGERVAGLEAARRLGVHPNTVRAMFDRGELTGVRTEAGTRMIDPASLEAALASPPAPSRVTLSFTPAEWLEVIGWAGLGASSDEAWAALGPIIDRVERALDKYAAVSPVAEEGGDHDQ